MTSTSSTTSTTTLPQAGTYTIDPTHTEVGFIARHLIGTKVRGRFTDVSGTFTVAENPSESSLEAQVAAASIHTNQPQRDEHLRTNDFLDVPNYPTLNLKSTGLKQVDDTRWVLTADLTIRGVTKSVDFNLEFLGEGPSMVEGKTVVAFSARRGDRPARLRRELQPLAARRQRRGGQQGRHRDRGRGQPGRLTPSV